jgi:hypothetical protein
VQILRYTLGYPPLIEGGERSTTQVNIPILAHANYSARGKSQSVNKITQIRIMAIEVAFPNALPFYVLILEYRSGSGYTKISFSFQPSPILEDILFARWPLKAIS